jgi:hypothetical protein
LKLKALVAGSAAALTLAGTAAATTYRVPARIHVETGHHHHVAVSIQKDRASNKVVGGGLLGAAVTYLGVDRSTIVTGLKSGQSLAQIATAHGKTADGLVAALLAPVKLKLDAAVAAGRLTSDRESTMLSKLQTALTAIVNKSVTPPVAKTRPVHVDPSLIFKAATSYLGVDLKTVFHDVRSGKTLADIAVAHGKTADGLVAAIVAPVKTKLDAQVGAGKIPSQQETDFLTGFQTAVAKIVNGS